MSKTLFLFQEDFTPNFFELGGDYSHLDKTYINSDPPDGVSQEEYDKRCDELNELVYTENGKYKVIFIDKPTKDWDHYVECGLIP